MKPNSTNSHDPEVEYTLLGADLKTYRIHLNSTMYSCDEIKEKAKEKFNINMIKVLEEDRIKKKPLSKYLKKKLAMPV
jgi:hypothetical protein